MSVLSSKHLPGQTLHSRRGLPAELDPAAAKTVRAIARYRRRLRVLGAAAAFSALAATACAFQLIRAEKRHAAEIASLQQHHESTLAMARLSHRVDLSALEKKRLDEQGAMLRDWQKTIDQIDRSAATAR